MKTCRNFDCKLMLVCKNHITNAKIEQIRKSAKMDFHYSDNKGCENFKPTI